MRMKMLFAVSMLAIAMALGAGAQTPPTANIVLTWQASTTAGAQYKVYRETSAGACLPTSVGSGPACLLLNSSPISALTFTDSGVSTSATVFYVVRATTSAGDSPYSNEVTVSFTTVTVPTAPGSLSCSGSVQNQPPGTVISLTCK